MPAFTFNKAERLKSRKLIGQLFREGSSLSAYPLRLIWMPIDKAEGEFHVQFAHSIPRRAFPKAVDRNRLGRKLKEAYRLHKHLLYEHLPAGNQQQYAFMVIYIAKEPMPYRKVASAVRKMIRKWKRQINP
ncbi:MAG: ribonuclease P protein component [Bacteroidota bacterium]